MSDTTLYFIRHAEVPGNDLFYSPTVPLNDVGLRQVPELAHRIHGHGDTTLDIIYTSPINRAAITAYMLGTLFNAPVRTMDELTDVHAPGYVGMPVSEFERQFGGVVYDRNLSDDQEPYETLVSRARHAVRTILSEHEGQNVGIVSHGDPLMVMMYLVDHPGLLNDPEAVVPDIRTIQEQMAIYINKGEACRVTIKNDGLVGERLFYFRGEEAARKREFR